MSKYVGIIDEGLIWGGSHNCCGTCRLSGQGYGHMFCPLIEDVENHIIEDWNKILPKCPFKPLPESQPIIPARVVQPDGYSILYKEGWNDCIKALTSEMIQHPSSEYCEKYLIHVSDDICINMVDKNYRCESCGSEHFSKYMSASGVAAFVCNSCKAVYVIKEKGE